MGAFFTKFAMGMVSVIASRLADPEKVLDILLDVLVKHAAKTETEIDDIIAKLLAKKS